MNDHDILIELRTNVKNLTDEVRLMRDNTKEQIAAKADKTGLADAKIEFSRQIKEMGDENTKAFKAITDGFADHEKRLRRNEKVIYIGLGILAAIQFFIQVSPIISRLANQ